MEPSLADQIDFHTFIEEVIHNQAEQVAVHNLVEQVAIHNLAEQVAIHKVPIHKVATRNLVEWEATHNLAVQVIVQNLIHALEVDLNLVVIVDYNLIDHMVKHILKAALHILAVGNQVKVTIKDNQD